jgi:flagellar hook protein FlgE
MFTAIGALNLHQSYLDVVANNLANANTIGYKTNRVIFQDQFSQLLNPGSSPTATSGGTNPAQIGLGVQLGSISPIFSQGMMQSTGRNLDLAIQGDGFLIYSAGGALRYSREGSLTRDANGALVNSSTGQLVQGWMANASGVIDPNTPIGNITIPANRTIAKATQNATFGGNLDSTYGLNDGDYNNDGVADVANATNTDDDGDGVLDTVDPYPLYPQVNVTMGIYDSLGNTQTATVSFVHTSNYDATAGTKNVWTWSVAGATSGGTGTITFDPNGQYVAPATATPATTLPGSTGANPIVANLDFSSMTMLDTATSASVTTQDGLPAGAISDVFIAPNDGSVWLVYTNGMREQMGQVALARFANSSGLIRTGNTTFQQGFNSGEPQIGTANSGGRGILSAGYLEGSNVDMAQEFTNMILAQRGFQASSRVITTSDEIIQELVNLKR